MATRNWSIPLLVIGLSACAVQPDAGSPIVGPVAHCGTPSASCRGPHTVRLTARDGSAQELSFPSGEPVVGDGRLVTIYPGETIYLEADVSGDKLVNIRAVPPPADAGRTMKLVFREEEVNGTRTMMLSVSSPYDRPLKYRLGMLVPERQAPLATSSCPVVPSGLGMESWPHPIIKLIAADFQLLPADTGSFSCE